MLFILNHYFSVKIYYPSSGPICGLIRTLLNELYKHIHIYLSIYIYIECCWLALYVVRTTFHLLRLFFALVFIFLQSLQYELVRMLTITHEYAWLCRWKWYTYIFDFLSFTAIDTIPELVHGAQYAMVWQAISPVSVWVSVYPSKVIYFCNI